MSRLEKVKKIENGNGLQYLIDSAYKIFQNPIAMFDTNYNLVEFTKAPSDDPLWNELISTGTFSMETQEFFAAECFTEEVANANKLVILKSSKLKYNRVLGNIFNRNNIKVANIVMVGCNSPIETEDTIAFEELADKITNEIQNDDYYTEYGRTYHNAIINKLLDETIKNPVIYNPHVQILYDGFEDYLFVAVVDTSHNDIHKNDTRFFKNILESTYPFFKYAIYSDYIIILLSSKNKNFYKGLFFEKANNPIEHNNMYVGVSCAFENLYELRQYYDRAVSVLKNGIKGKNNGRIFFEEKEQNDAGK